MFIYQRERPDKRVANVKSEEKAKKLREAGYQHKGTASQRGAGRGKPGLTVMPADLVEFFIKYYAKPGDVYLDPFMGQGIQMQVAKIMGLHYYGYDLSKEFFSYIKAVKEKIDDGKTSIEITCGDSRYPLEIPDNIGDFSFHSPPYWDIEDYGDEPAQLGNASYKGFLLGMQSVAKAWLPKFKDDCWHIVNVNDFRKEGKFYPYHADTIRIFQAVGWELVDLWVIDQLVSGLSKAFAVSFNMKRLAPKVHEYALVFRKAKKSNKKHVTVRQVAKSL
jgi:DNA modification methylase